MVNESIGNYRELNIAYDEVTLESDLTLTDFEGEVRISRTPQGLLVDGTFRGTVVGDCVRCLEEYLQPLEASFQELFAYRTRHTRDAEYFVPEDGYIDLEPLVYENLICEIPIKSICKPECKGLCPVCGVNLNETTCEHEEAWVEY